MSVQNSQMAYKDTPDYRAYDLGKAGFPEIPVIYYIRHTHYLEPVATHFHDSCFEVGVCVRGSLTLQSNDQEHSILAGDIFVNQPDDIHRLSSYPKGSVLYGMLIKNQPRGTPLLGFTKAETREIYKRMQALPTHLSGVADDVRRGFAKMLDDYKKLTGEYRKLSLRATAMRLIIDLMECTSKISEPSQMERIRLIIARLREQPGNEYDIDSLANEAALSPSQFNTQFKILTGLPPYHFLIKCRIESAKSKLQHSTQSVTEIAHDLGFCSSQHFAGHFKRATGQTPTIWRKKFAEIQ